MDHIGIDVHKGESQICTLTEDGELLGHGLEHLVRGVVEQFAGKPFTRAERLVLRDAAGEVFGVRPMSSSICSPRTAKPASARSSHTSSRKTC
jgi:hypothetical protein